MPRSPQRWLLAFCTWAGCGTLGFTFLVQALLTPATPLRSTIFIATVGLWLFIPLSVSARIQRRPEAAIHSCLACTGLVGLAGSAWLTQTGSWCARLGLYIGPPPPLITGTMPILRWIGGVLFVAAVPSLLAMLTLSYWMPRQSRLILAATTTLLTPAVAAAVARTQFLHQFPNSVALISFFITFSGVILAWACIAPPCAWEWLYQCRACGYDIRGLTQPICPECGGPIGQPSERAHV